MKNTELGRKIIDFIDAHPEQFDMDSFGIVRECGTVACLAGHAMLLSGYTLRGTDVFIRPDGEETYSNSDEAEMLLGMNFEELDEYGQVGDIWFDFENGPDRFRKLVERHEGNG